MGRDPWLDNAKMALVTLVVVGHTWTLLPETMLNRHLYDFLYAWHVPAFVLVTGYLSRSFAYTTTRIWQLVRTIAVPYVLFECGLALFRIHVGGENLQNLFANPHWPMWYLSALFFWRLMTPLFRGVPGRVAIPAAVLISLLAGLWAGDTFDMARILGLLPFFVIGLHATPERLERVREASMRRIAVLVLGGIAVLALFTDHFARTEWMYYRARYAELDVSDTRALLIRAVLLVVGVAGAWAFLVLVPRVAGWFTRLGAATLVVYLFHGFAVLGAGYAGFAGWAADHPLVSLPIATGAALGLALLLAWQPAASRLHHVVDPFGYAQRRVDDAVDLVAARSDADEIAQSLEQATRGPASGREPAPVR